MTTADFLRVRQSPEFLRLIAIIGNRIRAVEDWLPWERLVRLYAWEAVLAAAERADPTERWAERIEADLRDRHRARREAAAERRRAKEWEERLERVRGKQA